MVRPITLALIAALASSGALAQHRPSFGLARSAPAASVRTAPLIAAPVVVIASPYAYGYPYSSYRPASAPLRQSNTASAPYVVGSGVWTPTDAAPPGAAGWNWTRVDLPTLVAMARPKKEQ